MDGNFHESQQEFLGSMALLDFVGAGRKVACTALVRKMGYWMELNCSRPYYGTARHSSLPFD